MYSAINRSITSTGLSEDNQSMFQSLWGQVRNYIVDIKAIGPQIALQMQKLQVTRQQLIDKGYPERAPLLDEFIQKATKDFVVWNEVSNKIDQYLPEWLTVAGETPQSQSGLSFVPLIVISVAAVAALSFVVSNGLRLMKEYKVQQTVVQKVVDGKLTTDQAKTLIQAGDTGSVIGNIMAGVGSSMTPLWVIGGIGLLGFGYMKLK